MPTTLVTGASGGLGEQFARLGAAEKQDLVLVARSADTLHALATELEHAHGIRATIIPCDLSQPHGVEALVKTLQEKKIIVDTLINNAGFGAYGLFHETDGVQEMQLLAVNIVALTALTKALLPPMVKRGSGKIMNVASTAAFVPGPLMAVYYASKAYVLNFSLALSNETAGTGVTVTCVCPGPTATGFQKHSQMKKSRLFAAGVMDAVTVARIGYATMQRGKPLVCTGLRNKLSMFLARLAPRLLAAKVARAAQSPQ